MELVERPRKPASKEVLMAWAQQWAEEGVTVDWERLLPPRGFIALPRCWVVERTFVWLSHNRRMSKDYERLCATGEAYLCSDDSADGEAVGPCLGLFRQRL